MKFIAIPWKLYQNCKSNLIFSIAFHCALCLCHFDHIIFLLFPLSCFSFIHCVCACVEYRHRESMRVCEVTTSLLQQQPKLAVESWNGYCHWIKYSPSRKAACFFLFIQLLAGLTSSNTTRTHSAIRSTERREKKSEITFFLWLLVCFVTTIIFWFDISSKRRSKGSNRNYWSK